MVKIIIPVVCFLYIQFTEAQNTNFSSKLTIREGMCYNAICNECINNYTYANYIPTLELAYTNHPDNKSFININISGMKGRINPLYLNDILYTYNYIDYQHLSLRFQYNRKLYAKNQYTQILYGLTSSPYYSSGTQNYSNLLYSGATGFRKFYVASLINLSPTIIFLYKKNKNEIEFQAFYTLLNFACLPDDNYIKQLTNATSTTQFHLLGLNKYNLLFSNLQYERIIKNNWLFSINCQYRNQKTNSKYRIENENIAVLIGISKGF